MGAIQQQTLLLKVTSSKNMGNKLQPTALITLEEVSQGMKKRAIFAALYNSDVDLYEFSKSNWSTLRHRPPIQPNNDYHTCDGTLRSPVQVPEETTSMLMFNDESVGFGDCKLLAILYLNATCSGIVSSPDGDLFPFAFFEKKW